MSKHANCARIALFGLSVRFLSWIPHGGLRVSLSILKDETSDSSEEVLTDWEWYMFVHAATVD